MGSESSFWQTLRKNVKGHLERVENMVGTGTPDVNFCIEGIEGWIELKHVHYWPKRGGALKIDHYTLEQRLWHDKRMKNGGICLLFLQVDRDYFLFDNHDNVGESLNKEELFAQANISWSGRVNWEEFKNFIKEYKHGN